MKRWLRCALVVLGPLGLVGVLAVLLGVVPVAASSGHWAITEWFLHFAMQRSVDTHSIGLEPPKLDDSRLVLMGAGHYEHGCRFCHGAPGDEMPRIPHHMTPHPPDLKAHGLDQYDDPALFYIVRHGVKMTGMPAWPGEGRDDEVWAVVAFLRELPEVDAERYRKLVHGDRVPDTGAPEVVVERCARCHGADGLGRGEGAFPRLAGQRPEYLRASLEAYALDNRQSGIMEPLALELTDGELAAVVDWYASLPPFPALDVDAPDLGERIALEGIPERRIPSCADCHGPGHGPRHELYPRLAGQYEPYIVQQLQLFTERERGGTQLAELMRVVTAHDLHPEEMHAVAEYYASLSDDTD